MSATINSLPTIITTQSEVKAQTNCDIIGCKYLHNTIVYARVNSSLIDIQLDFLDDVNNVGIGVWKIQNNISDSPINIDNNTTPLGATIDFTLSGLPSNSIVVGSVTQNPTGSYTWTGLSDDGLFFVGSPGPTQYSFGSDLITNPTNLYVNYNNFNGTSALNLTAVAWE